MRILALESSAVSASAAVSQDGKLIGGFFLNNKKTHSETLLPLCVNLLDFLKLTLADIDLFAVSAGPGSFTGLRIGAATVKGMMLATGKLCVPLSTLEVIAEGARGFDGIVCVVMDARREQVYNALFRGKAGELERMTEDRAISLEDLQKELEAFDKPALLIGDGTEVAQKKLSGVLAASEQTRFQSAASAALLAFRKQGAATKNINPVYLRLSQAERELRSKTK